MKLVHWPLMDGLLDLVQGGGDWVWPQLAQAPPRCNSEEGPGPAAATPRRCTKCNSRPISGQWSNHHIAVYWSDALQFNVPIKGLNLL